MFYAYDKMTTNLLFISYLSIAYDYSNSYDSFVLINISLWRQVKQMFFYYFKM